MPTESTAFEQAYREQVASGEKAADPAQAKAVEALARLSRELARPRRWWRRDRPRGVYLYGPVGRGKTWLMDLFYNNLPTSKKLRSHFHMFMRDEVHGPLKRLRRHDDPLPRLAKALAERTRVICFDELLVEDIADAMLLGPLLQALFEQGVALVATANLAPGELYRNGLKRENFMPAIEAIQAHCEVVSVAGTRDYRADRLGPEGVWQVVAPDAGGRRLQDVFERLCDHPPECHELVVNDRRMAARGESADTVFFDFHPLCVEARSADDYLELAEHYRTLLLNGVPVLDDDALQATRRFISLIDVLYESHTLLVATAAAMPGGLYTGKRFRYEFRRTVSRLEEMRSAEWLAGSHLKKAPALTPL
ncbi:MAG TPA: cell division protein ZapE [Gammaproteobacteria bacterium]|nr:cell division protein ZapE [Gammaproteobacteria bacterium]